MYIEVDLTLSEKKKNAPQVASLSSRLSFDVSFLSLSPIRIIFPSLDLSPACIPFTLSLLAIRVVHTETVIWAVM